MNSDLPSPDKQKADDLFIDATLREHARLDTSQSDEALIQRILVETVNRAPSPVSNPTVSSQRRKEVRNHWILGVTAVAAIAVLTLVALQSVSIRPTERAQGEVHFVVTVLNPEAPIGFVSDAATSETPRLIPSPYQGESKVAISYRETAAAGNATATAGKETAAANPNAPSLPHYSLATTFGPSLDSLPGTAHRHESFVISADEERSNGGHLEYRGNVTISHDSFEIEASEATVAKAGTETRPGPGASLSASEVTVTQESTGRVVVASNLAFDPVSGAIHLSGVKRLVSGSDELTHFVLGDRVILQRDSYTVENAPVVKYANPARLRPKK